MTFADAMESLGTELGVPLVVDDGTAAFEVDRGDDDDVMDVELTACEDGESVDMSADLGEMPEKGAEELMMKMLEANHMFEGTGGAALSVEDGRAKLERRVSLASLGRGEGAKVVMPFLGMADAWAAIVSAE